MIVKGSFLTASAKEVVDLTDDIEVKGVSVIPENNAGYSYNPVTPSVSCRNLFSEVKPSTPGSSKRGSPLSSEGTRKKLKKSVPTGFSDFTTSSPDENDFKGTPTSTSASPNPGKSNGSTEKGKSTDSPQSGVSLRSPPSSHMPKSSIAPHDEVQPDSISVYQNKIIKLQRSQIVILSDLVSDTLKDPLNEVTATLLASLESEISRYQKILDHPLKERLESENNMAYSHESSPVHQKDYYTQTNITDLLASVEPNSDPVPLEVDTYDSSSPKATPAGSANAPLEFDSDPDSFDDILADESDGLGPSTTFPLATEIELVSSDFEIEEYESDALSDIEETDGFDITGLEEAGLSNVSTKIPIQKCSWDGAVKNFLQKTFKLSTFRPNQLEAINSTLMRKDVFILMPTGGGKSLCYQLPALIDTDGVTSSTVVVSPLISLMQDQIYHLKLKGISAAMLSSSLKREERAEIFRTFLNGTLRMLYVSPEMLSVSKQLRKALAKRMKERSLARIVIDEAHCVSSWGHDFRPDYKLLENLKYDFPSVPIMALTATANERVRLDIFKCLRSENAVFLKQSFNRPNLYYAVQEKSKSLIDEISSLMSGKFRGKSGIIYCHSRASCERTAIALGKAKLRVGFYHGSMSHPERERVQAAWHSGQLQAICATIAFGMGIDKADVRFVFHLTMPRNMEGYYQETGRAGRDGLRSECILFYHFKDALMLQSMVNKDDLSAELRNNQLGMLKRVIQYCQNSTECRRKQVLQYFSEVFDVRQCRSGCDNCRNDQTELKEVRDVTGHAKEIVELVRSIENDKVTMVYCADVYRGSRQKKILLNGHENAKNFGSGKSLDKTDVERIFHHLITEGFLDEYSLYSSIGFSSSYIKQGPDGPKLLADKSKINMMFNRPPESTPATGASKPTTAQDSSAKAPRGKTAKSAPKSTPKSIPKSTTTAPTKSTSKAAPKPKSNPQVTTARKGKPNSSTTANGSLTMSKASDSAWTFQENCYGKLEYKRLQLKKDFNLSQVTDVCSNQTLTEMAKLLPTDLEAFSNVAGITQSQIENFYVYFRPELVKLKEQHRSSTGMGGSAALPAVTATKQGGNDDNVGDDYLAFMDEEDVMKEVERDAEARAKERPTNKSASKHPNASSKKKASGIGMMAI